VTDSPEELRAAARASLEARGISFTREAFLGCIEQGDTDAVQFFLDGGMAVDDPLTEDGAVPLHVAVQFDQGEIVTLLLAGGASPEVLNHMGHSPLMAAVWGRCMAALEALVKAGVPLDTRSVNGETALILAARDGKVGSVTLLLEHGAAPDLLDGKSETALMHAARNGRMLAAEALLLGGADHTLRDSEGHTAVELAVHGGYADVARLLKRAERGELGRGAAPRARAWRPPEPAASGVPSRLWGLAWALVSIAGLLTVLNLAGASPWGPKLPTPLDPSPQMAAGIALRFGVEEIEAYREARGRLPASLNDLNLGDTVAWSYSRHADQAHYTLSAAVRGAHESFDSALEVPAAIGAAVSGTGGGQR
jgi:ankyrin repeat protein